VNDKHYQIGTDPCTKPIYLTCQSKKFGIKYQPLLFQLTNALIISS